MPFLMGVLLLVFFLLSKPYVRLYDAYLVMVSTIANIQQSPHSINDIVA